jgi:hypothetical protein
MCSNFGAETRLKEKNAINKTNEIQKFMHTISKDLSRESRLCRALSPFAVDRIPCAQKMILKELQDTDA